MTNLRLPSRWAARGIIRRCTQQRERERERPVCANYRAPLILHCISRTSPHTMASKLGPPPPLLCYIIEKKRKEKKRKSCQLLFSRSWTTVLHSPIRLYKSLLLFFILFYFFAPFFNDVYRYVEHFTTPILPVVIRAATFNLPVAPLFKSYTTVKCSQQKKERTASLRRISRPESEEYC